MLAERGARIPIIAKIENKEGVRNLEEIVASADRTMVARGDLGVEIPLPDVPIVQKQIIRTTVMNGKPVVTATQMLDSMQRNPVPTRAEVSDVANAILDGTSAVMLSGETAAGAYPVEAVCTMAAVALRAEAALGQYGYLQNIRPEPSNVMTEAVAQAAITMANHLKAAAIITLTESGFTSRSISKYCPDCPILAITSSRDVVRKLAMNWGYLELLRDDRRRRKPAAAEPRSPERHVRWVQQHASSHSTTSASARPLPWASTGSGSSTSSTRPAPRRRPTSHRAPSPSRARVTTGTTSTRLPRSSFWPMPALRTASAPS